MHLLTTTAERIMQQYTREDLIRLLDRSFSLIQEPGLYSDEEQMDLLDELQDAIDAEVATADTWE
jgi:hypothetical protein